MGEWSVGSIIGAMYQRFIFTSKACLRDHNITSAKKARNSYQPEVCHVIEILYFMIMLCIIAKCPPLQRIGIYIVRWKVMLQIRVYFLTFQWLIADTSVIPGHLLIFFIRFFIILDRTFSLHMSNFFYSAWLTHVTLLIRFRSYSGGINGFCFIISSKTLQLLAKMLYSIL